MWLLINSLSTSMFSMYFSFFEDNSGGRAGVLSIAYIPVSFRGTNVFMNNTGRVLLVSLLIIA